MVANRSEQPPDRGIVVVVASDGGLRAVSVVLEGLSVSFPSPLVVVQHRALDPDAVLVGALGRRSMLPVQMAEDGVVLAPGVVYVARPDLHPTATHTGRFAYTDGHRKRFVVSSANPLLISAAAVYGPQAIAVVLSGDGRDGTDGAHAVRAGGGTVIAQDEKTSECFEMPGSVIQSGAADLVLPIDRIAATLGRLTAGRRRKD